jgi:hypothetical protein
MTPDERLTPIAQELVPEIRRAQKIEGRKPVLSAVLVAAVVVLAGGLIYLFAATSAADQTLQEQNGVRDKAISDVQDQLKGVCRKVVNPGQLSPSEKDGCYRAENSIPPPAPSNAPVQQPVQVGLTVGEVRGLIADQVTALPRPLTIDQVTAVAADAAAKNKPKDGANATPDQIADAVASFCAGDSCVGRPGTNGEKGLDAPPVTDEQVRAQVAVFCAANNDCAGPPGATGSTGARGPQGISVQSFKNPERADPADPLSQCRVPYLLIDPATDAVTTDYFNVPSAFCL